MKESVINDQVNSVEIVRLLTCSDLRKNLILTLNSGPASLAELRERVDVSSTAAIHALRELEKSDLTYQDDKRHYALTNVGTILAHKLEDLIKTANVLTEHSTFWLKHDMSGIPEPLLETIGSLEESYLVTSSSTDAVQVYSTFMTLIENAKEVKGISSIVHPELINLFVALIPKEKSIELAVTSEVFDKILKLANRQELRKALEGNLKFFRLKEDPKLGFTVTDYFFSLGLFRRDGVYDMETDLLSYTNEALEWGECLFDYYQASSEKILASEISLD